MLGSQSTQLVVLDDNDKKSMVRTWLEILFFWLGTQDSQFFLAPKCVNRRFSGTATKVRKLRQTCKNLRRLRQNVINWLPPLYFLKCILSTFPLSLLFIPFLLVLLIFFLPLFFHILGFRLLEFFWLGTRFPKYTEFPALPAVVFWLSDWKVMVRTFGLDFPEITLGCKKLSEILNVFLLWSYSSILQSRFLLQNLLQFCCTCRQHHALVFLPEEKYGFS